MRSVLNAVTLAALLAAGTVVMPGCAGSGEDEVLEADPALSEQKREEYSQQMRESMQKQGRPMPKEGGSR